MENVLSGQAEEALQYLQSRTALELQKPVIGIICGSGLGGLAESILREPRAEIRYADIPHFPQSTVEGHAGKLLFGFLVLNKAPVVLMLGRFHYYEGYSVQRVTFPVRVMKLLGVKLIIVTNAAGSLSPEHSIGDLVILHDHINLAGLAGIHPLRGPNADDFGTRFPAFSDAYDLDMRRQAHRLWRKIDRGPGSTRRLHEGIYAFVGGPSYETRAECRMLRSLGADVVGMSTVPEIIVARHCNIKVLALSLVTNKSVLDFGPRGDDVTIQNSSYTELNRAIENGRANHEEVLDVGQKATADVQQLVSLLVREVLSNEM